MEESCCGEGQRELIGVLRKVKKGKYKGELDFHFIGRKIPPKGLQLGFYETKEGHESFKIKPRNLKRKQIKKYSYINDPKIYFDRSSDFTTIAMACWCCKT